MNVTPLSKKTKLSTHPPTMKNLPETIFRYKKVVGDLRYLEDYKRTGLTYITGRLGTVNHKQTERNWKDLK